VKRGFYGGDGLLGYNSRLHSLISQMTAVRTQRIGVRSKVSTLVTMNNNIFCDAILGNPIQIY
jgi:hypothetical protein